MEKLKLNKEFRRAYGRGKSFVYPEIVIYIFKTRADSVRFGITAGKKIGSAVMRNRAKRLITAAMRECLPNISAGCDVVFVARSRIYRLKSYEIAGIFKGCLKQCDMWRNDD